MVTGIKPVVLCILDGWGLREGRENNAPLLAETPNFDRLMQDWPSATLLTHGHAVGLPEGQMGNSEVGHTNIGAGRVVAMDLGQIDLAIEGGSFAKNAVLADFTASVKAAGGIVHLAGLVSAGGVHSHERHIIKAAEVICAAGLKVAIHAITDGRDVPPKSAADSLAVFEAALPAGAQIVTVIGRYYAMDRDNRWQRVARAYAAIIGGEGEVAASATEAVAAAYGRGEGDEFIAPTVIGAYDGVADDDGLFFANFRADRAREILRAIAEPGFDAFDTGKRPKLSGLLGMVEYSDGHNDYMRTMFPSRDIVNTLGAWVAVHGRTQFRLAETEKYPHVTFFLNGGVEAPEVGEDRYMAPSPKVATYDMAPEMSAAEVTQAFVAAIGRGYDLIIANYANPDMVGHTGDLAAAMRACEAVDAGLGQVMAALQAAGGAMIVTADHGNCETMVDPESGGPHTAHTTNPVPVICFNAAGVSGLRGGRLSDLAPSLLELMQLEAPPEMTGRSLLVR